MVSLTEINLKYNPHMDYHFLQDSRLSPSCLEFQVFNISNLGVFMPFLQIDATGINALPILIFETRGNLENRMGLREAESIDKHK